MLPFHGTFHPEESHVLMYSGLHLKKKNSVPEDLTSLGELSLQIELIIALPGEDVFYRAFTPLSKLTAQYGLGPGFPPCIFILALKTGRTHS